MPDGEVRTDEPTEEQGRGLVDRAADEAQKRGLVDESMVDKAREKGLLDKANGAVEALKNRFK
ncbi:MAG: hypothetical protein M3533_05545 [Actinomycetota bacterium]|nr:hypothetical protein [Actinomycetota bacterium]